MLQQRLYEKAIRSKRFLLNLAFLVSIVILIVTPASGSETMTFNSGANHPGFSFSNFNSGGGTIWTANLAYPSIISKSSGTFDLISILYGTPYYEGNSRNIVSDRGHSVNYSGRGTLTLNWRGISWIKISRISGSAPSGDIDNIVFTPVIPPITVPLGSEPPDLGSGCSSTFTVSAAGLNTVKGSIGPTPGDTNDSFCITVPATFGVTEISYSGPSGSYYPLNVVGCGLTGTSNLNQTFSSEQSNCSLQYAISTNYSINGESWTVTLDINTHPVISGTAATPTINDNDTTTPFSPLSVSDADGDNVSVNITYTAANGSLSGTGLTGSAGNYTLTSNSESTVTSRLQTLVFTPTMNQVAGGSSIITTFTLTPNDGIADGAADSNTQVTAISLNDPLIDVILVLQVMSGAVPTGTVTSTDINGDGKIGVAEAIHLLKKVGK